MSLRKELGFWHVFSIAAGAMISSGIFILPGIAYSATGPSVIVSYLLSGILATIGVLSVIELSTAMPKAGGDYFFITRSLGPLAGTVSGILSWLAISLKSAFAIFGISELIYVLLSNVAPMPFEVYVSIRIIGFVLCILFAALNIAGAKEAGSLEIFLVAGLLSFMVLFIVSGIPSINTSNFSPFFRQFTKEGREIFSNGNITDILIMFGTAGTVFVSYGGLLKVSSVAEEIENPRVNIPTGLIAAVTAVTAIYALMLTVVTGVLPSIDFAKSLTPIADAAKVFLGNGGFIVATIAASFAFVTTANAGIMSASRYPFALSRDNLLPPFVGSTNAKLKTPVAAILITSLLMSLALFLPLEILVKSASTVILTSYVLANISVLVLRESKILNYRPSYKTPLYPVPQIISIIFFFALIVDMGMPKAGKPIPFYFNPIFISTVVLVCGVMLYVLYGRRKNNMEYALLHIMERVTNKVFTSHKLADELRTIIHERDDVDLDRFDRVITEAPVVDLQKPCSSEALFAYVSEELSKITGMSKEDILTLLEEREAESSTVINNFVAIPHIIVPGEKLFKIVIARGKEGIHFPGYEGIVQAVFVLAGSKDERNFHLRSISAIAQIIQGIEFEKRWLEAQNDKYLKDVLLLEKRKRMGRLN